MAQLTFKSLLEKLMEPPRCEHQTVFLSERCAPLFSVGWGVHSSQTVFKWCSVKEHTCNLLKIWSGRPGSNRRRPAWESPFRLKINNQAAHGDQLRYNEISNFRNSRIRQTLNGVLLEGKKPPRPWPIIRWEPWRTNGEHRRYNRDDGAMPCELHRCR